MARSRRGGPRQAKQKTRPMPASDAQTRQGRPKGIGKHLWPWIAATIGAALAAVILSIVTGIPGQLVQPSAAKDILRSGPDFYVSTEVTYLDDEGRSVVVPGTTFHPSSALGPLLDQQIGPPLFERLASAGAVSLEKMTLRMTVVGNRNQDINIVDIRPQIVTRTAPLDGTLFDMPPQGGAPTFKMMFDFDQAVPIARTGITVGENAKAGPAYFGDDTIPVKDGKRQVLIIRSQTVHHYVAFNLLVEYTIGDATKTITVTDNGKPFQVTGDRYEDSTDKVLSYQQAYGLGDGFILCPLDNPRHLDEATLGACM